MGMTELGDGTKTRLARGWHHGMEIRLKEVLNAKETYRGCGTKRRWQTVISQEASIKVLLLQGPIPWSF